VSTSELKGNRGLKQRRGEKVTWLAFQKRRGEGMTRWREGELVMRLRTLGNDGTSRGER
jgi:hypothetical protein